MISSLYLCHGLAFLLARAICLLARDHWNLDATWLNACSIGLGLALTAAFTTLSFQAVERPARRRGQRVRFDGFTGLGTAALEPESRPVRRA